MPAPDKKPAISAWVRAGRFVRRWLIRLTGLVVAAAMLVLIYENPVGVEVGFGDVRVLTPVGVVAVLSFALGTTIGAGLTSLFVVRRKPQAPAKDSS